MRIVAGRWRGHSLFVPNIPETRPTMDRTRQAIFNILRSAAWAMDEGGNPVLHDAHVLDVFAGSGAMGFEAMSQGASSAVFIEMHPDAVKAIEKNGQKLKTGAEIRILKTDIQKIKFNAEKVARIAFFDAPYHSELTVPAIKKLLEYKFIDRTTLLVIEMHTHDTISNNIDMDVIDQRNYGMSKIIFGRMKN